MSNPTLFLSKQKAQPSDYLEFKLVFFGNSHREQKGRSTLRGRDNWGPSARSANVPVNTTQQLSDTSSYVYRSLR